MSENILPNQPSPAKPAGVMTTARIETLSDGIFAIAMTLLILDLKVPELANPSELSHHLFELWPQLAAYIISFLVISVYWIGHHNQFVWIKHTNRTFLWINIFFLMAIAFLPFSTSLLASYNMEIPAVLVYGVNVILAGLALLFHWSYATDQARLTNGPVDAALSALTKQRIIFGIIFYAITTLVSFYSPRLSFLMFALLPILYMIPSRVDKIVKSS